MKNTNKKMSNLAESAEELKRMFKGEKCMVSEIVDKVSFKNIPLEEIPPELLSLKRFEEGGEND
jgi:hypothetical protein